MFLIWKKKILPQPFHKVIMLEYTAESLFILTAKFLVCTHVKSRSCFKFVFSSSLLFLRLKLIFKETTDFVCVVFHLTPPPLIFATKREIGSCLLYSMLSPFQWQYLVIVFIFLESNVQDVRVEP